MAEENDVKWEKKWLPDGKHCVYVHRITGEQTEPIVPQCTCRCRTEQIETKFTPFYHETIRIKEEICSKYEEEEFGKDTSCAGIKLVHPCDETNGRNEDVCSLDEENEFRKDIARSDSKDLSNSREKSDLKEPKTKVLKKNGKNIKKKSCYQSKSEKINTSYICKKCKKELESLKLLQKHFCADNDFDYICCTCEKVFKTRYDMTTHLENHGIKKTKVTDNQYNRKRIQNNSTDETKSKRFKCICLTCKKIFTSVQYAIQEHMKTHSKEKPYVCDLCGSAFSSANNLSKHRKIHSGKKPYQCKICGKAFSTNPSYLHHLSSHKDSRPFSCSKCSMAFKSKPHLNQHILYKHSPFSFICEKCSKKFPREADLRRHSIVHGDRVASYECEECGKTFRWPNNFKMHRQTHDKRRPTFPCTVCGKVLMHKKTLIRHMVLHNDDANP